MKNATFLAVWIALAFLIFRECNPGEIDDIQQAQRDTIYQYINLSDSTLAAEFRIRQYDLANLKTALQREASETAKILRELNVKVRDLQAALSLQVVVRDSFETTIRDTIYAGLPAKAFSFADNYLSLDGTITSDRVLANYSYRDTIDVFTELKGDRFTGFARLRNPHGIVEGVETFSRKIPRRVWDLRASVFTSDTYNSAIGFHMPEAGAELNFSGYPNRWLTFFISGRAGYNLGFETDFYSITGGATLGHTLLKKTK